MRMCSVVARCVAVASKMRAQVGWALPEDEFHNALNGKAQDAVRDGYCVSFSDTTTRKSTRKDLLDNAALLQVVCRSYPDRAPPAAELIALFSKFDSKLRNSISRATTKTAQRVWADGESKKLKHHVSLLRELSRRTAGSDDEALGSRSVCRSQHPNTCVSSRGARLAPLPARSSKGSSALSG